jgi:hypothetical protein
VKYVKPGCYVEIVFACVIWVFFLLKKMACFDQSYQFCSVLPEMAETFHTNSKNRTKQNNFSSHFKSRSVPDFSAKFRSKRSGFIPYVPFRS